LAPALIPFPNDGSSPKRAYRLLELFFRLELFFAELRLLELALAIVWCLDDP
jgi:hypothetical protein